MSNTSLYNRLRYTLALIDYLLIHASALGIDKLGISALTRNDLVALLDRLARGPVSTAIYDWPSRLSALLRDLIEEDRSLGIAPCEATLPHSSDIPPERVTDLNDAQIAKARCALWRRGFYERHGGSDRLHAYRPNSRLLMLLLFPSGLVSNRHLPIPPELLIHSGRRRMRECSAVPIRAGAENPGRAQSIEVYRGIIQSLAMLSADNLPSADIPSRHVLTVNSVLPGRFRTVPAATVLLAFRKATEFVMLHGDDLVDSYLAVARSAADAGLTISTLSRVVGIETVITQGCRSLGVRRWSILAGSQRSDGAIEASYHVHLRANVGLVEALRVLYGACLVLVGSLSARRDGELCDLIAGEATDSSGEWMFIRNRKSGPVGLRDVHRVPLPSLACSCIRMLERLQQGLIALGGLRRPTKLFAYPRSRGHGLVASETSFTDVALDSFCDWSELPINEFGQRNYLRQHQLRRFFAMAFFWGNGFGGLDTLRSFLGHADVSHVYHYISEAMPGAVLRGIKAQYVRDALRSSSSEELIGDGVREMLFKRFSTFEFHLLSGDDLEAYVRDMIEDGSMHVEPVFLDRGGKYKVLVEVQPDRRILGGNDA
ncbi:hypothetical protein [Stenotrophomonas rhizophila]|uniref:Tyr recombinase domain-containing protein n=1 Tax=Stenotrophomonas rhizophila TaxID=216778 RepID=A0AAW5PNU9_9GAMM|nr:hypothetical protein [Stenotrophomonas rhizophila]MCS4281596.1 hypothetical protein [Stenotrophomonas rhizophila]